jgi:hypothetical protein
VKHAARWKLSLLIALSAAAGTAYAGASCLLFPLSCLAPHKKYGEEIDALVLGISSLHTDIYTRNLSDGYVLRPSPLDNTREFFVGFQVGMTRYVAWKKDTVVQMAGLFGGYTPKPEKWNGKTVKMRFMDENWMGLKTPVAAFKTPEGKEWKLVIIDIIGPDGLNECPPFLGFEQNMGHCKPQADVDRAAREQEILAKMKAEGRNEPAWQHLDAQLAARIATERDHAATRNAGAIGVTSSATVTEPAPATASTAAEPAAAPTPAPAGEAAAAPPTSVATPATETAPAAPVASPAPESSPAAEPAAAPSSS